VLSVFKNETELLIVIESLPSSKYGFTASTNISSESTFEDHPVSLTIGPRKRPSTNRQLEIIRDGQVGCPFDIHRVRP
jgi:hypothetical protein